MNLNRFAVWVRGKRSVGEPAGREETDMPP